MLVADKAISFVVIDIEDALESLGPGHRDVPLSR